MQDFPPNSHRAKEAAAEEPKRVERVTSGEAVRRKRGLGKQFKGVFINGDAKSALNYMAVEVIVPAARDTLIDALQGGIEKLIYGDTKPKRSSGAMSGYASLGHVNYQRMGASAAQPKSAQPRMLSRGSRARHDFDEIVIPSRQEAEEVIDRLFDLLDRYGSASVADLYELTGIQGSHTDVKWGWFNLRGARAARLRSGGYLLDLPEPQPLDQGR
jgi:hypothetical protein